MGRTGDGLAGTGATLVGESLSDVERGALSKAKFDAAGSGRGRIRPGNAMGALAAAGAAVAVAGDGERLAEEGGTGLRERSSRDARRRQ